MPKDSTNHHHHQHHHKRGQHPSSKDPHHRAHRDHSGEEARSSHQKAKPLVKDTEKALSGDNNYVREWLARTEKDNNETGALAIPNTFSDRKPDGVYAELSHNWKASDLSSVPNIPKGKRKRQSSSDSSLLEEPARPQPHQSNRDEPRSVLPKPPRIQQTPPRKKQRVASSESGLTNGSDLSGPTKETFEKRARHKTREDRYEPKKREKKSKNDDGKPSRKKREKRGDRKKAAKKAGEDLIQNFSSKNISRDRLTIRPSHGLGLFNNGRASSPARRRGLPDLAFSEMEFLRHPSGHQHVKTGDKVVSRSRERDKKKASKKQDEISTFFRPRAPLEDLSSNHGGGSPSSIAREEHSLYSKQLESERNASSRHAPTHLGLDSRPRETYEAAVPSPGQQRARNNYDASADINRSKYHPGSPSNLSGRATTCVSWSQSQRSPALTSLHGRFDRRPYSQTPDSVRRALMDTGIFRDTGIMNYPSLQVPRDKNERQAHGAYTTRGNTLREEAVIERMSSSESCSESSESLFQGSRRAPQDILRLDDAGKSTDGPHEDQMTDAVGAINQNGTRRQRIVVEHYDPKLGWCEDQNAIDYKQRILATPMKNIDSQSEKPTRPLSREHIAKNARIKLPKRPATTESIVRDMRKEINSPLVQERNRKDSNPQAAHQFQTKEDVIRAGISSMYGNLGQRPLLSRVSNLSLPTIYEESQEYSPSHGEAILPQIHSRLEDNTPEPQPRLISTFQNNQFQAGSPLPPETQESNPAVSNTENAHTDQDCNQNYLLFPSEAAWTGNHLGSTLLGPPRPPPISIGAGSLYLRQMQGLPLTGHNTLNSSEPRLDRSSWDLLPPANDPNRTYPYQRSVADLATYSPVLGHRNGPAMYHGYEGSVDHMDVEYYSEPRVWDSDAHDQVFADQNMLEDQQYYENQQVYEEEQPHSASHLSAYQQQFRHNNHPSQANDHHNGYSAHQSRY